MHSRWRLLLSRCPDQGTKRACSRSFQPGALLQPSNPLLDAWARHPAVSGPVLGAALAAASHAHDDARLQPSVEVVVSGPSTPSFHARRTEQVLRQLIAEAHDELLLMTYSLSMYDELRVALEAAIARDVRVIVVSEDPADRKHFTGDPVGVLAGLSVTRLRWPAERRKSPWASMHAKVVVVDRSAAFVTSANLSETAANDSLEAGILLRGGDIPMRLADHIDRLRMSEELRSS